MLSRLRMLLGISVFWVSLSMLFDGINTLLLPNQLLQIVGEERSATFLGLLTFFGLMAAMLLQPYAGAWSDRLRRRRGRKGMIGLGVLFLLLSLALFGAGPGLVFIILGYFLIQISASLAQAGQQGFIPDLVPQKSRGTASGLKGFMDIGGAMLGFILLGWLLGEGNVRLALLALGLALLAGYALTVVLVREPRAFLDEAQLPQTSRISFFDALRLDLDRHRAFAWLILSRFLFLLGTYAIGRFLLLFVAQRLNLPAAAASEQAGTLLAALALITVLAAIPGGWAADRLGRRPLMLVGSALSTLGALLLMGARSESQILAFGALLSLGNAAFLGANWAMTADLAPSRQAGRFFGLANFGTGGAAAAAGLFGPLVDGANSVSSGAGYTVLFFVAALTFVGSALSLRGVHTPETRAAWANARTADAVQEHCP